jgi:flagellar protein FliO/FliZ
MSRLGISKLAASLLACISFSAGAVLPTVPTAAAEPVRSFGAAGLLQVGFGLAMVLALIFLVGWAARRFGLQQTGSGRLMKVVSSAMVGQRERVVVVEIGGSWLVLGVAAGQVRALHTMPAEIQSEAEATPLKYGITAAGAFSQKLLESLNNLNKLRKRD